MKKLLSLIANFSLISLSFPLNVAGEDGDGNWPQWRGPTGNGTAPGATPPTEWSEDKNVAWKVKVPGVGSASPIVWQNKIFIATSVPSSGEKFKFILLCYDRENGKVLWERLAAEEVPSEGHHKDHGHASASPITDGKRVYAHFGSRGIFAYDLDGELQWSFKDFGTMTTRGGFGEGSTPVLHADHIVVPWDHEGASYITAINKNTGEQVWKTARDEPTSWATPLVVEANGKAQVIANGQNKARAYDLRTGEEVWSCGGQTQRPVACPVANDEMVFIGSGFRGAFLGAFRYGDAKGDIEGTKAVAWTVDKGTPDIASPVLSENLLYYTSSKTSLLTCVDAATGKVHYERERPDDVGTIYASPIAANGYLYIFGRNGTTAVIKDGPKFEVVGYNDLDGGIDATPAFVGNDMIVRTATHLYRISAK